MKVAIGYRLESGPWGGGNRFVLELVKDLELKGHIVVCDLNDADLDIILIMDPRHRNHPNITFGVGEILKYIMFKNSKVVIVQRINECDERKKTRYINFLLRLTNYVADHTVFIASWLIKLNVWRRESDYSVILNGSNTELFYPNKKKILIPNQPLRLITHHWGANRMKGFDIYEYIDKLLDKPAWSKRIQFTYVGNTPKDVKFKNITHLAAMNGKELADCIREHDIYLTASMNEPAGMHHIEGACCGLPLLYRNSGALPEYCTGFGVGFDNIDDFEDQLNLIIKKYDSFYKKMHTYENTSIKRIPEWVELFELLTSKKEEISLDRKLWRNPLILFLNKIL
jgi:glycosyltransferase involved in cell wall biosynthesis